MIRAGAAVQRERKLREYEARRRAGQERYRRERTAARIEFIETAVAEGQSVHDTARTLGIKPLSIERFLERHHRNDLWTALKGDSVTWNRAKR